MKAFIITDMQNDFIAEKGTLRVERAAACVEPIKRLKAQMKKEGVPVVYVCDTHFKIDMEFEMWGCHVLEGSWGAEIIEELKPDEDDYVLRKWRYSAFFETGLDVLLRQLKVDTIVLTGVLTDICLQHTAADAFYRGYKTVVPRQCTDTFSDERKEYALNFMNQMYGTVVD